MRRLLLASALAVLVVGCGGGDKADEPLPAAPASIRLRSSAFPEGGTIPERYTCAGEGLSPELGWSHVPTNARELTLVVEDPDAGGFIHWTLLGLSPRSLGVGVNEVPAGAVETQNSAGKRGWTPPCPPKGDSPHRYVFAVYSTDAPLALGADASPGDVRQALADHAIARGTLTGRFGRR
jgi:Raf kinase inhibitor-like YbhB/YbcL family protein